MYFENTIFGKNIASCFLYENVTQNSLLPEEKLITEKFAEVRSQSFANGRYAARMAMKKLDIHDFPLLIGKNKAPIWPKGIKGSISHCHDAAIAIASKAEDYLNLGVDIEKHQRCKKELWQSIFLEEEIEFLNSLKESEQVKHATLLFSAKESYFKLLNPIMNKWIGFHDAKISLKSKQSFDVIPKKEFLLTIPQENITGKYDFAGPFVMSFIALDH